MKISILRICTDSVFFAQIEGFWMGPGHFFLKKGSPEISFLHPLDVMRREKVPVF